MTLVQLSEIQAKAIQRGAEKWFAKRDSNRKPFAETFLEKYRATVVFDETFAMIYFQHREKSYRQESVGLYENELFCSDDVWQELLSTWRVKTYFETEKAKEKAHEEGYRRAIATVRALVDEWGIKINTTE